MVGKTLEVRSRKTCGTPALSTVEMLAKAAAMMFLQRMNDCFIYFVALLVCVLCVHAWLIDWQLSDHNSAIQQQQELIERLIKERMADPEAWQTTIKRLNLVP